MCWHSVLHHNTLHVNKVPVCVIAMQFVVNDTKKYNYNGEIEEKIKDMGRPNLVKIRQKQASFSMAFVTVTLQLMLFCIDQCGCYFFPLWIVHMNQSRTGPFISSVLIPSSCKIVYIKALSPHCIWTLP